MAEAEVKVIQTDWVLITYDIPTTAAAVRRLFLRKAAAIGAVQFTESCYVMPYSDATFALANELAEYGYAIVWKSRQEDKEKAVAITEKYEVALKVRCDTIDQRLDMAQSYMTEGRLGMVAILGKKTLKLLKQMDKISQSFNPSWLKARLEELVGKWNTIYG